MPTLHWIGKEKVINHHLDVPYRVLEHKYAFDNGVQKEESINSGNKIIHGDNLEALKALLPEYEGKINCISIDPPYNTGSENWRYNDNVSHPKIKKWFKEVVGREGDDFSRHDKWLCMMYPRLKLLNKLLKDDGLIFINIDDNELSNLIILMNEIFGPNNKLAVLVWDLGSGTSAGHFTRAHEYIVVYAKDKSEVDNFSGGTGFIDDRALKKIGFKNPASEFTFPAGTRFNAEDGLELQDEWGENEKIELVKGRMICENGKLKEDVTLRAGWTQKKQMKSWFDGNATKDSKGQEIIEFYFRSNGKIYCRKKRETINPSTVLRGIVSSKTGSQELLSILGANAFDYPKPSDLIKFLIELSTDEDATILDSFAGSGTLGHAILKLNQNQGDRKFILIQMSEYDKDGNENDICFNVTAERIKRVINGYLDVPGLEGGFEYYELGPALFNDDNEINELVGVEKLRNYIYYTETKEPLLNRFGSDNKKDNEYLLNKHNDTAYYFFYEQDSVTTLNHEFLSTIKTKAEQYVIYADNCLLTKEFMTKHHIIFKKIPRDITKF